MNSAPSRPVHVDDLVHMHFQLEVYQVRNELSSSLGMMNISI
jgi:hypothetical protein